MPSTAAALASPECFAESMAYFSAMLARFSSQEAGTMTHSELERELEAQGRELLRRVLQEHLDLRSPGEAVAPVRDALGLEHPNRWCAGWHRFTR